MTHARIFGARSIAAAVLAAGCVNPASQEIPADGIHVGVLLPFSGELAASGSNIERALMFAEDDINAGGGIDGQLVRIETYDTHSDPARGLAAAEDILATRALPVVIGPEETGLAQEMISLVQDNDAIHVMPGVTAPTVRDLGPGGWVRLSPSAVVMGCVLAIRMTEDGAERATVLFNNDDFSFALADAFQIGFRYLGGTVGPAVPLSGEERSFSNAIRAVQAFDPEGTLLLASPEVGSALVQEWSIVGSSDPSHRFYFSPTLEADGFPRNSPPGVIDGMIGVAPAQPEGSTFAQAFGERWGGDVPSSAAFRYYDALALLALAWQSAAATNEAPTNAQIRQQMQLVSGPPGEPIEWSDLARGLELASSGTDIDFRGASGEIDLDIRGDPTTAAAVLELWEIRDSLIRRTGERATCPAEVYNVIVNQG
jgi:neutral amino acid transport system substrate-binding protein